METLIICTLLILILHSAQQSWRELPRKTYISSRITNLQGSIFWKITLEMLYCLSIFYNAFVFLRYIIYYNCYQNFNCFKQEPAYIKLLILFLRKYENLWLWQTNNFQISEEFYKFEFLKTSTLLCLWNWNLNNLVNGFFYSCSHFGFRFSIKLRKPSLESWSWRFSVIFWK